MYGQFQNNQLYMNTFADEEKRKNFVRRIIQMLERNIRKLEFSAGGVSTLLIVVDLKNSPGPGKKELWLACDQLHQLLQENYPEVVEKQVFINVPRWYLVFNAIIRPFLNENTKSKFVFAGPSKAADTLFKSECIISWELRVLDWGVSYSSTFLPGAKHPYTIILDKKRKMGSIDEEVVANKFKAGSLVKLC
ncbi:UNVERIFIED_CONTAM: Patellin-3 [Sesamum radiatum]|uniref:Patellin-3 n=1 Tax=Sesamum radiatum TaxID=300843 RepID=A0AAW2PWZ6_SESRA